MAGWRYAFFHFGRFFPYAKLRVRWRPTKTKDDASELESRMLLAYLKNHYELPPLNYKFNWQIFEKDGGDSFGKLTGTETKSETQFGLSREEHNDQITSR